MFRSSLDDPIKRAERDLRQAKQKLAREAKKKQQELLIRKRAASQSQEKYPTWKLDVTLDSFYEDYSQDSASNRRLRKEQSKEYREFLLLLVAFGLLTWLAIVILRHTLA